MKTLLHKPALAVCLLALLACTACSREARRDRELDKANRDFEAGRYERAEIGYRSVLRTPPPAPEAIVNLGKIYHSQGRWQEAAKYLNSGVVLVRDDFAAHLAYGETMLALGALNDARKQAVLVLEKQPANERALQLLADATVRTNDLPEALAIFAKVPQEARSSAGYLVAQGNLLLRQRQLEPAEQTFKLALERNPKESLAHAGLATIHLAHTNQDAAVRAMRTAAELAPLNSRTRIIYAEMARLTGDTNEARRVLKQVTDEAPTFVPAWLSLAQMTSAAGDLKETEGLLRRALTMDPENFEGLMLYGDLMLARKEGTNAATHFERLGEQYKNSPIAGLSRYKAALASLMVQDTDRALQNLNQAITANSNDVRSVLLYTEININRRNPTMALPHLTRLLQTQPGIPEVYLQLRTAYDQLGNTNEALNILGLARTRFPDNPQVPLSQGIIYQRMGRLPEARTAYREALSLAPESQAVFKQALDLELLSGNFTNAFDLILPRLEKQPDSPLVNFMAGYAHQFRAASRKPGTAPDATPTAEAEADLRKAAGYYQRAIDLEPRFSDAYLALAALKARHESKQKALVVLQEMTTRNTNDANGFFQLASLQTELGNYSAARDAYEQSLALAPTNFIILNNLAYIYSERVPDLDKALNYASEARRLARGQPSVADTLGWIHFRRGEYQQALPLLQESYAGLRANNTPSSEVEYHLGMALYMLGDEDQALARLQAAGASAGEFSGKSEIPQRLELLNLNPAQADAATLARLETLWRQDSKDPVLARKLGLVYERQGNVQKAKEVYEQALQRHDHNPRLLVQAAELYAGPLKDEGRAAELAKRVRTLAPDNAAAARLLGRLALRTGDYRWARSLLEQSVQRYPDDPELPFDLAWADYSFGNTESALERARRSLQMPGFGRTNEALAFVAMVSATNAAQVKPLAAEASDLLKRDPNYVPALMVMGLNKEADQRPAEALPFFAQALTVFTNFAPAVRHLALAGFRQGNYSPTNYALITRANSAFPNDPELQKALGITAGERGEFARADQTLQRLVQAGGPFSEDAAVNFYLGKAKVNLRRASDARPFLEKALKSSQLPEALRREAKELLDKPAP